MNRRYFLKSLGVGASSLCISSRFLLRAERYAERYNAPLVKAYIKAKQTLYVREGGILCLGDPYAPPSVIPTWREWYVDYCHEDPTGLAEAMGMSKKTSIMKSMNGNSARCTGIAMNHPKLKLSTNCRKWKLAV